MPFGPYKDFSDCVSRNSEKDDPDAYCATVQREIEGKSENGDSLMDLPEEARSLWTQSFADSLGKNVDAPSSSRIAWASVYRRYEKRPNGNWSPLKVFIENAAFRKILKADRVVYGAASVAIKDTDNDLVTESALRSAFNSYIERGHVLFFHRNIPVGEVLPAYDAAGGEHLVSEVRDGQLNVVVRVYKDTKIADEVWGGIESGALRAFSIGGEVIGSPVKVCEDSECKSYHNRIDQIDLHEISIVPEPANQASYFSIVKSQVIKVKPMEESKPELKKAPCGCKDKSDEDIARIVAETVKVLNAQKAEHPDDCPEGQHMVDGECVPKEEEKSKSETKEKTMSDETKTEPKTETNPLEARVAAIETGLGEIKSLLTKALEPKAAPEPAKEEKKEAPAVREKVSVDTNQAETATESILGDKYHALGESATWEKAFAKAAAFENIKEW